MELESTERPYIGFMEFIGDNLRGGKMTKFS